MGYSGVKLLGATVTRRPFWIPGTSRGFYVSFVTSRVFTLVFFFGSFFSFTYMYITYW